MRFVAFLRAINVAGRNVKMEQLRRIFASVGLANVETVIASGNVVFESRSKNATAIEKKLQTKLEQSLGYAVATYVRSMKELDGIAQHKPFKKIPKTGTLFIAFAHARPSLDAQKKLLSAPTKTDKFLFHDREIYWLCLTRFSDSKFSGPSLEKILGISLTVRTSGTVGKIAAKCAAAVKEK